MLVVGPLLDERQSGSRSPGTGYFYNTVMRMEVLRYGYQRLDFLSAYMRLATNGQSLSLCVAVVLVAPRSKSLAILQ